jgi:Putative restriction endonuclease
VQLADLDLTKLYTYADYYKWRFDERVELIKGKIFRMNPAPNYFHQVVTGNIFNELKNFLLKKSCKVCIAPFDVRLPKRTNDDSDIYPVLKLDVCVICDRAKIDGVAA